MILKDLATISPVYRERIKKVKQVDSKIIKITKLFQNPNIILSSGKYIQEILFLGEINEHTKIQIYCSCPSFNFEFAHILNDNNCLLYPEKFKLAINKTPRKKNKYSILTGCKHCISSAQYIQKKIDHIQNIFYKNFKER